MKIRSMLAALLAIIMMICGVAMAETAEPVEVVIWHTFTDAQQTALEGFGQIVAESIVAFFAGEQNCQQIDRLAEVGVNMQSLKQAAGDTFAGKTFVLTGTLPTLKRSEAKELIDVAAERKGFGKTKVD